MLTHKLRLPFSLDPLIAEAKQRARRRRTLITLGVLLLAGLAADLTLTSPSPGGNHGSAGPPNNGSARPTHDSLGQARANQARLRTGDPVKLLPGRVSTDPTLGMKASFEVFDHWYGEQRPEGGLFLAKHLSTGGYEVSTDGGIEVDTLDSPLARTARGLETLPGIRIHDLSPIRLGSHSGRRYSFYVNHLAPLGQGINVSPGENDVILLGVGNRTLVIKKEHTVVPEPNADQLRREALWTLYATPAEAERVIHSFRFHS